ncbi:MAG: T9SS type A sorting domain-containing protein [Candidatus Fibromonas sp.]|jgi:uncharacterized membrane protein YgcG|nr:T9SS type A sorting domain-containing protein [Candidatus Fibromonas sp.]
MKNRPFATVFCCFLLFFAISHSAVNYPYPQAKSYGNGTINVTTANTTATLKDKFTSFLSTHYEESGNYARIKWDETDKTVSEGIGYGMLMMVYFSDNTTSYQSRFDKLWAYYQRWVNERGLMRWKIQGFSSYIEENAASDAEFDVAAALVMAHYQFGTSNNKNYLDTAKNLIAKIRQHEISPNNLHKPGDVWDNVRNPSYISPAAFEIFKEIEPCQTAKDKWASVITANYTLLKANQNSNGLFSDWCADAGAASDNKGSTSSPSGYSYDAARVPWRVAWANAWYGHADAKTVLTKVNTYLSNRDATNTGFAGNSTFVGPFTNALSTSGNQNKMNSYWGTLMGFSGEPYYSKALQLITGLLATGNMPNLRKLAGDTKSAGECSNTGDQIDQFATAQGEDKNYARTWEPWYAFTDKESGGASTIQNTTAKKDVWNKEANACKNEDTYNIIMQDGSDYVAKIDRYSLSQGTNEWHPFIALGLDAEYNGSKYNFSGCTGGFSYKYKGSAHNFRAQLKTVKDYGYHSMEIPTTTTAWTEVVAQTSELKQEAWPVQVTFKLSDIDAFAWEVKGNGTNGGKPITGISPQTGSLAIKDFKCVGTMTFPDKYPPKCGSGSGGTSSSSVRSSSSRGSSSSARSSSSGGSSSSRGSSLGSSSSGDDTPVLLPQLVYSNALIPMQNAVNLQATGNATVRIFDLKGNAVRTLNFAQGNYVVQIADLPKGLYLVKASSSSWKQTIAVPVR